MSKKEQIIEKLKENGCRITKQRLVLIWTPSRHLIDAYRDVRGGKVTQKEPESALQRPYCPLVH